MIGQSRKIELLAGILILFAFVIYSGCSNNNPVVFRTPGQNALPLNSIVKPNIDAMISAPINGISGGRIEINNGRNQHDFEVQPGSLPGDVIISVNLEKNLVKGKNALIFEFGPDGLAFRKPAKLHVDMRDLDTTAFYANLYYYDSTANDWILIEKAAVKNGKATFNIFHFSKYAIEN